MTTFATPSDLLGAEGTDLGVTDWLEIDQDRVNRFADATGDHQWIHVDAERAARESPFGTTIAHGYLTLSLCNLFLPQLLTVERFSMGLNYGLDRVRFPAAVPVGSRVRARGVVKEVSEVRGGAQIVVTLTVELEGSDRPAAVVDTVSRFLS